MSRPTDDELEDPAETGRHGCLMPDCDVDEPDEPSEESDEE